MNEFQSQDTDADIAVDFSDEPTRLVQLHRLPAETQDQQHKRDLQLYFTGGMKR